MFKDKGLVVGIALTILLISGGLYYFTKGQTSTDTTPSKVSDTILVPEGDYKTSGIVNGNYMDSTSSAKITMVEFGDYECPACGTYHPFIKQLITDFAGKINFVFRNFPLSQHANAQISSQAVEAAGLQGKFWQMHDKVYESQAEWSNSKDAKSIFIGYAGTLGLNVEQYKSDIDSAKVKEKVQSDYNDGTLAKINATPTYFVNGIKIETLPSNYAGLKRIIEAELNK